MFSKTIALILSASALTAAVPFSQGSDPTFGLIAIHSTSPVHNQAISASKGKLWIHHVQDASCDAPTGFATFYTDDTGAYLYAASDTPQQLFVDRSGMGQGYIGYTTGAQSLPRNGERIGFEVDSTGRLHFDDRDFLACPTGMADGSYTLWLTGVDKPAGIDGCVGIALNTIETDSPVGCAYTS